MPAVVAVGSLAAAVAADRVLGEDALDDAAVLDEGAGERRARWGGDAVSEGFVRLSIGLEDVRDLLNDFERALGAV